MADTAFQQGLDRRIIDVKFTAGGVLFVRCHSLLVGEVVASINPEASVKDLPDGWNNFNFFGGGNNQKDPNVDPRKINPAISNPITSDMLTLYRYWQPRDPITTSTSKTVPGTDTYFIDNAAWEGMIDGFPNFQLAYGVRAEVEELLYQGWVAAVDPALSRDRYSTRLAQHLETDGRGHFFLADTPPPPSPTFFFVAANSRPPWTYHVEPGPPITTQQRITDAIMIFNLSKLRGSLDTDPTTKEKPKDFTFKILAPHNFDKASTTATFQVEAGTYKTSKPSVPPKDTDGRRNFPVHDKEIDGITQYLVPDWTPFPNKNDSQSKGTIAGFPETGGGFELKVTFGKDLKVELSRVGGTSGPG